MYMYRFMNYVLTTYISYDKVGHDGWNLDRERRCV